MFIVKINKDWLVGFVDGEGCFYVGVNKNETMKFGYQVLPEFRIVQHKRDVKLLFAIRTFFGHGNVVTNKGKNCDVMEYRVRKLETLSKIIIPFFEKNKLQTVKKYDFIIFRDIIRLIVSEEHLTREGIERIKELKSRMNRGKQIDENFEFSGMIDKDRLRT